MTEKTARSLPVLSLTVLTVINLVNYLDRYVVAGVLPQIEDEFHLDHAAAGAVATIFMAVYIIVSPLAGYLGDRRRRYRIIAASVVLWSLATVASGLARNYTELLLARAAIGFGEAGYGTIAPTLISDLFSRGKRSRMLAIFYAAIPVGAALGYLVAGWVTHYASWHVAFFVSGVPGLLLGLSVLWLPEPERGSTDVVEASNHVSFRDGLRALSKNRVFWLNTTGYVLLTFSIGGLAYWIPNFLERERGMSALEANSRFGTITVVAGLLGTLFGGFLGDWAERRRKNAGMYVSGTGLLLAAPLMFIVVLTQSSSALFGIIFATQFFLFMNSGPINAVTLNSTAPSFRSFAMGLNTLLIHLFGDAFSPPLIGAIADRSSLAWAIQMNAVPVLLGGLVLCVGAALAKPRLG